MKTNEDKNKANKLPIPKIDSNNHKSELYKNLTMIGSKALLVTAIGVLGHQASDMIDHNIRILPQIEMAIVFVLLIKLFSSENEKENND